MNLKETISISHLRMKLLGELEKYHPNLIANLSKEALDIYSIKESVYNDLLKVMQEKDMTLEKISNHIENKINECKMMLKEAKSEFERDYLKLKLEISEEI